MDDVRIEKSNNNFSCYAYAAMSKNDSLLRDSSSGGIFPTLAKKILDDKGIVYGCSLELVDDKLEAKHIYICDEKDLWKIQGSKYVQSKMDDVYKTIRNHLESGKKILFCGTPCQVAGVKAFLRNDDCSNLYTIDVLCHGTPRAKLFDDYLKDLERRCKGKVVEYHFRDKYFGWDTIGKYTYVDRNGRKKQKYLPSNCSSYFTLFLNSEILRDACYSCRYASMDRPGDISLGDYWGIEKEEPNYLIQNGGLLDEKKGISCVLINSIQGERIIKECEKELVLYKTDIEKIKKVNKQLVSPSKHSKSRDVIMRAYEKGGYRAIERYYRRKLGIKYYSRQYKLKKLVKRIELEQKER